MGPNRGIEEQKASASARGFTLPELMIAVGIICIMATVSLPALAPTIQTYRLRTAAWQLAGDLRLARQKAISTTRRHRVCFSNCGGPVPADGYLIQREGSSGWEIEAVVHPTSNGVRVGSNATITFSQTGEAAAGTVTLASGLRNFQVRTHFTGKVTVCGESCA